LAEIHGFRTDAVASNTDVNSCSLERVRLHSVFPPLVAGKFFFRSGTRRTHQRGRFPLMSAGGHWISGCQMGARRRVRTPAEVQDSKPKLVGFRKGLFRNDFVPRSRVRLHGGTSGMRRVGHGARRTWGASDMGRVGHGARRTWGASDMGRVGHGFKPVALS